MTVRTVKAFSEAEAILASLPQAGLHPVDLTLSAPMPPPGVEKAYSIQVPNGESKAAKKVLEGYQGRV